MDMQRFFVQAEIQDGSIGEIILIAAYDGYAFFYGCKGDYIALTWFEMNGKLF